MYSQIGLSSVVGIAAAVVMSTAVLAQETQPKPSSTVGATSTLSPSGWLTREAAGEWRASRMVGLNVYNEENEKIGSIVELIVDRTGKLEAVVVGAGGFLGIGERDVAVPYGQINWVFTPVGRGRSSTGAIPADTARSTSDRESYPDHAVLNMTKEQLKTAPAFLYSH
jgi:sporulation protein YlmC with PRC-barrel domain